MILQIHPNYRGVSKISRTVLVKRNLLNVDVKFIHHLQSTPLLHEYTVEVCIDRHSRWDKFSVYDPLLVKETNEHRLQFAFFHAYFFGSWRPRTLPLRRLQFCLWVVSINDDFIACDDVQEECGIIYHSFLQILTDRYSKVFLIVGQHSAQTSLQSKACSAVLREFADKIHNQFQYDSG